MAGKGNSRHMGRLAASNYMRLHRKASKYVAKPNPGRHTLENNISLITLLKEKMGVAADSREARILIKKGDVSVNGKLVRDWRYPVGFGDTVSFGSNGESYRIDVARHGVIRVERCSDPAKPRPIKVIGKYIGSGGRIMIRLYDGAVIEGKSEVMVNDSVNVKEGKVESVIRFAKGAKCYVIKGTHSSESGTVKDVIGGTSVRAPLVSIDSGKGSFQTLVENVMVIGEQ